MRHSISALAKVNIQGLDRVKLLKVLWEQQPPALFYSLAPDCPIPKWDEAEARDALKYGYIDYFCGRCIKTDITKDIVDTKEYNASRGPTFEDAISKLND